MASSVFYKFNSRKDESRVTFDGTGISIFDLKRDIILANNMGKANDFDLAIFDSSSKQGVLVMAKGALYLPFFPEYTDDSQIIPRSSSVIVKRLPAARNGKGKAALYTAGVTTTIPMSEPVRGQSGGGNSWHKGAMSKRFDGKEEGPPKPSVCSRPTSLSSLGLTVFSLQPNLQMQ
jgi:protein MPE1